MGGGGGGVDPQTPPSCVCHCSRERDLRKMRNFGANFTDFEPEINIIKCKTENVKNLNKKLESFNARL